MQLYLVRHGETIENAKGLIQGWLPGHLNGKGKEQASVLAKKLKKIKFDCIYTSDLKRSYDTAMIIRKYHPRIKLISSRLLRERNFGIYQGNPKYAIDWKKIDPKLHDMHIRKGESIDDVEARAGKFLKFLKGKNYKIVLVVTHGFVEMVLRSIILNKSLDEILGHELNNGQVENIKL